MLVLGLTVSSLLAATAASVHADPTHSHVPRTTTTSTTTTAPAVPHFRFISWDQLSDTLRHHAHKVGYEEKNWNKLGTNKLEELAFDDIHSDHILVYDELVALGFVNAPQWDCYINHYRAWDWSEMDAAHQTSYTTLGWTQDMWDEDVDEPDTEDSYWDDLTTAQQAVAQNICYSQQTWDDIVLPLWGEDDGKGGSDTQEAVEKEHLSSEQEKEAQVAEKQDVYDSIYDPEDQTPPGVPVGPRMAHNSRGIETPFFRYNAWEDLTDDVKLLAKQAHYNGKSWDSFDSEKLDFETLGKTAPKIQQAMIKLGFSGAQYDCHMIHYRTYDWDELNEAGVQQHYVALGWTSGSWDEDDDAPATDGMYWPDLSQAQQDAAYELCYFRETWDEVSMQFWPRTTANSPLDYAKDYAKTHPVKTSGAAFITLTVLVGMCFCCACACRALFVKHNSFKAGKDLEMYQYDQDNIQPQESYRDDPTIESVKYDYDDDDIAETSRGKDIV
jgi:hypothetical protein